MIQMYFTCVAPWQIDPAVETLRQANPKRFHDARPGHLAVVAMAGRPWFIGRVCDISRPVRGPISKYAQVLNIDSGDMERIPLTGIVELLAAAN
ncbi:hypothetical protein KBY58_11825 [Cyanobium sp. HWJ4-Hawea]|uniref:hypothetical protein n=1 Tax=unclassified Cyanobium TaxID=2627006 RepID=UPI0020CBAF63|nr:MULTISPECIES: hypothetical protein [unclassified Cyanobium]MCP9774676.1 hypothetical protein [Cyanobium sp. WAJ14-Wanaka]MCP9810120.1 hypothetical protein [Cyanobium sp. HWJ4-Hawea]